MILEIINTLLITFIATEAHQSRGAQDERKSPLALYALAVLAAVNILTHLLPVLAAIR